MFHSSRSSLGTHGETSTADYLQNQGFTILERNFRVRSGEVDIIASKGDLIVFVEVKTRSHRYFNTSQVVTRSKQKKIISAARQYLLKQQYIDKAYRFDVALVEGNSSKITYLPHAFSQTH